MDAISPTVTADPLTAHILWWLYNRARPKGPNEARELLALIDDLEAGRERYP